MKRKALLVKFTPHLIRNALRSWRRVIFNVFFCRRETACGQGVGFIIICFSIILLSSNFALADDTLFEKGLKGAAKGMGYDTENNAPTIENRIGIIIQVALSFLGVIFFLLMIYGGFLWMTAKGNEQQLEKAKNLITAAIIGLVIVVAAYAISYFMIKALSEKTTLNL